MSYRRWGAMLAAFAALLVLGMPGTAEAQDCWECVWCGVQDFYCDLALGSTGRINCGPDFECDPGASCHLNGPGCSGSIEDLERSVLLASFAPPPATQVEELYGGMAVTIGEISLSDPPDGLGVSEWYAVANMFCQNPRLAEAVLPASVDGPE